MKRDYKNQVERNWKQIKKIEEKGASKKKTKKTSGTAESNVEIREKQNEPSLQEKKRELAKPKELKKEKNSIQKIPSHLKTKSACALSRMQ